MAYPSRRVFVSLSSLEILADSMGAQLHSYSGSALKCHIEHIFRIKDDLQFIRNYCRELSLLTPRLFVSNSITFFSIKIYIFPKRKGQLSDNMGSEVLMFLSGR